MGKYRIEFETNEHGMIHLDSLEFVNPNGNSAPLKQFAIHNGEERSIDLQIVPTKNGTGFKMLMNDDEITFEGSPEYETVIEAVIERAKAKNLNSRALTERLNTGYAIEGMPQHYFNKEEEMIFMVLTRKTLKKKEK